MGVVAASECGTSNDSASFEATSPQEQHETSPIMNRPNRENYSAQRFVNDLGRIITATMSVEEITSRVHELSNEQKCHLLRSGMTLPSEHCEFPTREGPAMWLKYTVTK